MLNIYVNLNQSMLQCMCLCILFPDIIKESAVSGSNEKGIEKPLSILIREAEELGLKVKEENNNT